MMETPAVAPIVLVDDSDSVISAIDQRSSIKHNVYYTVHMAGSKSKEQRIRNKIHNLYPI